MSAAEQLVDLRLPPIHDLIASDARDLSAKLHAHRLKLYPPEARKILRRFSSGEAAKLIGVNDGYLRQL
jgi:chromosome partitioning protein